MKTAVVLADLSSAFDTVWREAMLLKIAQVVKCKKIVALIQAMQTIWLSVEIEYNLKPKYLGVILDRSLTFKPHLSKVRERFGLTAVII